jgi:hypothetical protein
LSLAALLLVLTIWAVYAFKVSDLLNQHTRGYLVWIVVLLLLGMTTAIAMERTPFVGRPWLSLLLAFLLLVVFDLMASALGLSSLFGPYFTGNFGLLTAFSLVAVVAVVVTVQTRRVGSEWLPTLLCASLVLLGLGAYFYLPIASMTEPPGNWGYARAVEGFFHLVTRGQYELPHPTSELALFLTQLWFLIKETSKSFGWPYFVFTALPIFLLSRTGRNAQNWLLGLAAVFVCVGPLMVELLNPPLGRATIQVVSPYFGAMNTVLALWTGLGLMMIGSVVSRRKATEQSKQS